MANPAESEVQNLLPVQAYFDAQNNFVTFIGQNKPFYATPDPQQSGLHITNSTIDSSIIGGTTPAVGYFTSGYVSVAPTTATGIANKQYVDYYAAGLSWKQPVKAASLANIASLSGFQIIDAVPLTDGDRVLVKDQSLSKNNGIYVVRSGAWEYAVGADDWQEYVGAIVFVEEGSQAYSAWYSLAQEGGTLGVTALDWANFSVSSTYSAGTGLTLLAGVFSITNTGVTNGTYGSASRTITQAVNAQGQLTSIYDQPIDIAATQIGSGTIDSARLSGSYSGITGLGTLLNLTVTNAIVGSITGNAATATLAGTSTNITGGATGSLPYQTAANTTGFLAPSTNGYILSLSAGVPAWIPNDAGTVTSISTGTGLTGGPITSTGTISFSDAAVGTWAATPTSANLKSAMTDETGSGALVFADGPTLSAPTIDGANPYIRFLNGSAVTNAAGRMWYNGNDGSLNFGMGGGNITQQVGEELFVYGKATATIADSPLQIVYKTGTIGASGVITFAPTVSGLTDSGLFVGCATEPIASGDFGRVTCFGAIHGIDTRGTTYGETWVAGDVIWYNPTTGNPTKVKPSAPNIKIQLGTVINVSATLGTFHVEIIHGSELGGTDSNVQLTSPSNGQILSYDGSASYWKNTSLTAGTGISISASSGGVLTVASTVTAGLTVTDDTTTNATRYIPFTSATTGTITGENVASTKLQFNPSTGVLSSTGFSGSGASLTALSASNVSAGTLAVAYGGTGANTLTANNVLLGNGTSALQAVAPSTTGNVLTSNGTTWVSSAPPSGGQYYGSAAVKAIAYNSNSIAEDITILANTNGLSAGPVTIATGYTVTVATDAVWVIV